MPKTLRTALRAASVAVLAVSLLSGAGDRLAAQSPYRLSTRQLIERIEAEKSAPTATRQAALNALGARKKDDRALEFALKIWDEVDEPTLRRALVRCLGVNPEPAALRKLEEVFTAGATDRTIRDEAARALAGHGHAGEAILVGALGSSEQQVRTAAVRALGTLPDSRRATRGLLTVLDEWKGREGFEADRALALRSLRAHLPDRSLVRWLSKHMGESDPDLRAEIALQLVVAGHREDEANLTTVLASAEDPASVFTSNDARGALAVAIALTGGRRSEERADDMAFVASLVGGRAWVFRSVVNTLDDKTSARLHDWIVAVLGDDDLPASARTLAFDLLDFVRDDGVKKARRAALEADDVQVALHAYRRLDADEIQDKAAVLEQILERAGAERQAEVLRFLDAPEEVRSRRAWIARLEENLEGDDLAAALVSIDKLGLLRARQAFDVILPLLARDDWRLQSAAIGYLVAVPRAEAVEPLIDLLARSSGRIAAEARDALQRITGMRHTRAEYWRRWWDENQRGFEVVAARDDEAAPTVEGTATTFYGLPVESERLCFVIDVSGSMNAKVGTDQKRTRLDVAKQALVQVAQRLESPTRTNVISFESDVEWCWKTSKEIHADSREELVAYVRSQTPQGGTNVHDALQAAFSDQAIDTIFLLSDGAPSAGPITDAGTLAYTVATWNLERRIRIHTVSIGGTSQLLKDLAADSGGRYVER